MRSRSGAKTKRSFSKGFLIALSIIVFETIILSLFLKNKGFTLSSLSKTPTTIIGSYHQVPEYARKLKRMVITLSITDKTLEFHDRLLKSLPEYTQILLLLPKSSLSLINEELADRPYRGKVTMLPFNTSYVQDIRAYLVFPERDKLLYGDLQKGLTIPHGTIWAQDLFEVAVKDNGKIVLLVSDTYKWFTSYGGGSKFKVTSDNNFISRLSSAGVEVQRLKLTFSGGNLIVDEIGGRRILFCGGDVLRKTKTVWRGTRDTDLPTEAEIAITLKKALDVEEVIFIGQGRLQPTLMFHLDQAMLPLAPGVVGVTNLVGERPDSQEAAQAIKEVELFLTGLKSHLLRLGYRILAIDTSMANAQAHQYYVNAIPYIDDETNQRTLLMPVFAAGPFEKELEAKNRAAFESVGYNVVPVYSKAYKNYGGIHCLVNVLE